MHKCLGCKKIYEDIDHIKDEGCPFCGSKYFIYYKKGSKNIKEIEKDILEIIKKLKEDDKKEGREFIFEIESIIVPTQGKYIINLEKMFKEKVIVFKVDEGKYIIDF